MLVVGLSTPIVAAVISLGTVAIGLYQLFDRDGLLHESSVLFIIFVSTSIVLLGPGAFSIDSRLFGRRRIVIPDRTGYEAATVRLPRNNNLDKE